MRECETHSAQSKTVKSGRQYCAASEITVRPESIKQRVIEPVVVTNAVQIKESSACSNCNYVGGVLIPQQNIKDHHDRCYKKHGWHENC